MGVLIYSGIAADILCHQMGKCTPAGLLALMINSSQTSTYWTRQHLDALRSGLRLIPPLDALLLPTKVVSTFLVAHTRTCTVATKDIRFTYLWVRAERQRPDWPLCSRLYATSGAMRHKK